MADIHIVRKPPIWAWIATAVALLLIVGLILWAVGRSEPEEPMFASDDTAAPYAGEARDVEPGARGTAGVEAPAVREYLVFAGVTGNGEQPEPGRHHDYTAEGLRKLAAALQALPAAEGRIGAGGAADDLRSTADRIQRDPTSDAHAQAVRNAFVAAAEALPNADLRDEAEAISPQQPLLDQTDAIREFFEASGEAVRDAAQNRTL